MGLRILLIDDEVAVTENLTIYLEGEYHAVETLRPVKSSEELAQHLKRFQPEGVILDFEMTPIDGGRVYRWIKEWKDTVPVIFYTKHAKSPTYRDKMLTAGASEEEIIGKQEIGTDYSILIWALKELLSK